MTVHKVDGTRSLRRQLGCEPTKAAIASLSDRELAGSLLALSIWQSPECYRYLPTVLPHVVRDWKCRPHPRNGVMTAEAWASPDDAGYIRDDNSLVKGLPRSLNICSPRFADYDKKRMGSGFVAAHIWPDTRSGGYSTRHGATNSFWPNTVWLPRDLAKLTDQCGSFAQRFIQAVSWSLYRYVQVDGAMEKYVKQAWAILPDGNPSINDPMIREYLPRARDLNYFRMSEEYVLRRLSTIDAAVTALEGTRTSTEIVAKRILPSRYISGLRSLNWTQVEKLYVHLRAYASAVREGVS